MTENLKEAAPPVSLVAKSFSDEVSEPNEPAGLTAFPEVKLPSNEQSIRTREAMHIVLNDKHFKKYSIFLLTSMCALIGLYAASKPFDFMPSLSGSTFSGVHHSKTVEGYEEQALLAFVRTDLQTASDAWQKAFDRAKERKITSAALAKLYVRAGDTLSGVFKGDVDAFSRMPVMPQYRTLAQLYYSKALKIYEAEKLTRQELNIRYRLANLSFPYADIDEIDNLKRIIQIDPTNGPDPSGRMVKAYYTLGDLLEKEGDNDGAATYLQKAIRYDSQGSNFASSESYLTLSRILRSKHRYSELIQLLKLLEARRTEMSKFEQTPSALLVELKHVYDLTGDRESAKNVEKAINDVNNHNIQ